MLIKIRSKGSFQLYYLKNMNGNERTFTTPKTRFLLTLLVDFIYLSILSLFGELKIL